MTPSQRLAALLAQPIEPTRRMGWRGATPVSGEAFNDRARRWQAAFEQADGQRFALFFADGIEFSAALFGPKR